jgi:Fic family protein
MTYIYLSTDWPQFAWNAELVVPRLSATRYEQGLLLGRMKGLGDQLKNEATLAALTEETVKSSAIEGEELDPERVRSSLARHMGLKAAGTRPADRNVEGVVEMMLDATQHYASPLTEERIFGWHAALFPAGRSGMRKTKTGAWREGPMEVVSGPEGKQKVHFEARKPKHVQQEMKQFLSCMKTKMR